MKHFVIVFIYILGWCSFQGCIESSNPGTFINKQPLLDSFSTSIECDNKRKILQGKLDSIMNAEFQGNDLSTFEESSYGKKYSALKAAVKDNKCPELETLQFVYLLQKEETLRSRYNNALSNELHKNDPICDDPQLVSYSVEKNSDFQPFFTALINNNCNKELISLKVQLNFDKTKSHNVNSLLNSCRQNRIIKVKIPAYSERTISFRISNTDECFDSDNPIAIIREYCRKNETAKKTVGAVLDDLEEKVKKQMGQ